MYLGGFLLPRFLIMLRFVNTQVPNSIPRMERFIPRSAPMFLIMVGMLVLQTKKTDFIAF